MFITLISAISMFAAPNLTLELLEPLPPQELRYFAVYPGGSILSHSNNRFWYWDASGKLLANVKINQFPEKMKTITSCEFSLRHQIFIVYDYMRESVLFFDKNGKFINQQNCNSSSKSPVELFEIRQFIQVKDKLFALDLSDIRFNRTNPSLLTQLQLKEKRGLFRLERVGPRFAQASELQKRTSFNFKSHWVFEDAKNILVIDQLSRAIRVFARNDQHSPFSLIETNRPIPFLIRNHTQPDLEELRKQNATRSDHIKSWVQSFTRIVGFYEYKDGYLVVYNPQCKPDQPELLGLQRLSKRGDAISDPVFVKGRIVGSSDGRVWIISELNADKPVNSLVLEQVQLGQ